jgi:hypothetical protein
MGGNMKKLGLVIIFTLCFAVCGCAQEKSQGLLLDSFECDITGGPAGTVDFGAGNGSSIMVTASTDIKHSASQSLKIVYNAVPGGYMYAARGFGLDAKNTAWLVKPEDISWKDYNAISFYMYGSDSKTKVAFDVKDSGNEMWRFIAEDNFTGWKQVVCPFAEFYARSDWQPNDADKNANMDFPLKVYQFEPLPEAKGTLYFADVELVKP